jgi:AcrR family transcriptional regulator
MEVPQLEIPNLTDSNLSEKEQRILESAIRIFSEKGFSATTTSEIAKSANVAEGTIFRYFKTKKDILRGILIQAINVVSGSLVLDPVEKILLASDEKDLRVILKELLFDRMKLVDKFFPMARVIITEALYHEDVRDAIYQSIIKKAEKTFKISHQNMLEKGMIREDIEVGPLFRNILGNFFLFIAQRKLFGDKFVIEDMEKDFDKMLDVIMFGITRRKIENG